ncbi:MAG: ABC transporter ATP-binding protein [Mycoplasmatales bacterium]
MLKKYLKEYRILMIVAVVLVFFQVWSMLAQPGVISDIISELSKVNIDKDAVYKLGFELVGLGLVGLIAGVVNTIIAAKISQGIGARIREDGFKIIQGLSFQDIEKFSTSNLVVRLTNDVTQVQNMLMMGIQMLLRVPFLFVGAFVLAIMTLPRLWWTIILFVVIIVLITMFMMKALTPRFKSIQGSVDTINTIVKENIDGVRVVKSFVAEKHEGQRFDDETDKLTDNLIATGRTFASLIPVYMLTANLLVAFAIYFVAGWALDDVSLIGDVVSFTTYVMQIMFAIIMAGFLMMTMSRAFVSAGRISEVLDAKPSFGFGNDSLQQVDTLDFKNVYFKYEGEDDYALEDISFSVKKGEKIGVVGATGSGKTTLVQLIPRLYDIEKGEIAINGQSISTYNAKSLRENISMVLQKAHLFSGTIKEVVLQGNSTASTLDVEIASKRAQAFEFIQKKEGKFEGEVYQKGANFSGGQKQRLSIARGLVKDPEILILDDSTSALDAKSENLVKEAINKEFEGVTTFIVAQKISSVLDTDKIIVLADGKVDAIGKHKDLIKTSVAYREIYETQKGKEE